MARQNIVKNKFTNLYFNKLLTKSISRLSILNFEIKTKINNITAWNKILILGLSKIFLSDKRPKIYIAIREVLRVIRLFSKKNIITIIKKVPPIIRGDLFVSPKHYHC